MSDIPKINASPTKEFFVAVLVRDVTLEVAISEFIENSIDGAKRVTNNGSFADFYVKVKFDKSSFVIEDNCGGIPVEIAQNYAFRFGRTKDSPVTSSHPIGQFGVGMKRSLFRIGNYFSVKSTSQDSSFSMEEDIEKWKSNTSVDAEGNEKWEFNFKTYNINEKNQPKDCGTTIKVTSLHPNVSADFETPSFLSRLKVYLEAKHSDALRNGLKIKINELSLSGQWDELLTSKEIKPFFKKIVVGRKKSDAVETRIYAGISTKSKDNFGWYVYCNGVQVLKADKSRLTGWDSTTEEVTKKVPKAHTQFDRFRGYVYFESSNASILPWNTMKHGINENSEIFQAVRLDMVLALRQIVDFLNKLDSETESKEKPLNEAVNKAEPQRVAELRFRTNYSPFKSPVAKAEKSKMQTISYQRTVDEIKRAKQIFKEKGQEITTNERVGLETFKYFMDKEDLP